MRPQKVYLINRSKNKLNHGWPSDTNEMREAWRTYKKALFQDLRTRNPHKHQQTYEHFKNCRNNRKNADHDNMFSRGLKQPNIKHLADIFKVV